MPLLPTLALLLSLRAPTQPIDHIVIIKSTHTLRAYSHGQLLKTYPVALGRTPGPKQQQGDHRTPEGHYLIDALKPISRFHKALHLSYPNDHDRTQAAAAHHAPGSDIEIHGVLPAVALLGSLHRFIDWTDGCIALTNPQIDELYALTPTGTPVDIQP